MFFIKGWKISYNCDFFFCILQIGFLNFYFYNRIHVGCVMKNADHEMKKYGTYITEQDNNEGGVAEVIQKFMLKS